MSAHRVAIIGDATSVSGFRPLGFDVFPLERPDEARALWTELLHGDYGVIFMTEAVYESLGDLVAATADSPLPAVTVIPAAGSGGGVGAARLDRAIERALGISVPHREEEV